MKFTSPNFFSCVKVESIQEFPTNSKSLNKCGSYFIIFVNISITLDRWSALYYVVHSNINFLKVLILCLTMLGYIFTVRKRSCRKVIFSQVCVRILSTGGMCIPAYTREKDLPGEGCLLSCSRGSLPRGCLLKEAGCLPGGCTHP